MGEVTRLLEQARREEPGAWDSVVALLYEDLLRIARRVHGAGQAATLNPAALVNECYLRIARRKAEVIESREHFLAVAARAMRQILVNYARDRVAAKRGGGVVRVTLNEQAVAVDDEAADLLALHEALTRLADVDPRMVQVVDCRVFGGMTEAEAAVALGLSLRTVQRLWQRAREQLHAMAQT